MKRTPKQKSESPQTIRVEKSQHGHGYTCYLQVGDTKARLSVDKKGMQIRGSSPSDGNNYYTLPLIDLKQLKAMIWAIENAMAIE